jgi:hypothetical protein
LAGPDTVQDRLVDACGRHLIRLDRDELRRQLQADFWKKAVGSGTPTEGEESVEAAIAGMTDVG